MYEDLNKVWDHLDSETRKKIAEAFPAFRAPVAPQTRQPKATHPEDVRLVADRNTMTITIHALERMEERWPDLCEGLTDEEVARIIQGEINDALVRGRHGTYCPLELAHHDVRRWGAKRGAWYCWNEDKTRGYACRDNDKGVIVLTTLVGDKPEVARRKLQRGPTANR